ncbi:MAG: hypothetical protein HYU36_09095 [Planctomycetes bacterium]|nr:hypothetical protein [Planctomycetota bacterium]
MLKHRAVVLAALALWFQGRPPMAQAKEHEAFAVAPVKRDLELGVSPVQYVPVGSFGESWDTETSRDGKRLYEASGAGGLSIFDISDATSHRCVGRYVTGGIQFRTLGREWILDHTREARAVRWVDGRIRLYTHSLGYDVDHWKEMVLDLQDEATPRLLFERFVPRPPDRANPGKQKLEPRLASRASGLLLHEGNLYLLTSGSRGALSSHPIRGDGRLEEMPVPAPLRTSTLHATDSTVDVTVVLGLASERERFPFCRVTYSLSVPGADGDVLERWSHPPVGAEMAVLVDGKAYAAVAGVGLGILDVAQPGESRWLGRFSPPLPTSMCAGPLDRERDTPIAVALVGHMAYLANGRSGLFAVDVTSPSEPKLKGHFWDRDTGRMVAARMVVDNDTLYLCDWDNGVVVLDISGDGVPRKKALYHTAQAFSAFVDGDRLWVANGGYGLVCMDKRNGRVLAEYRDGEGYVQDVVARGDLIYTAEGWRVGVYEVRPARAGRPAAFTFHGKGKQKPLKTARGTRVTAGDVPALYGKDFAVKVDGVDVCSEAYPGTAMRFGPVWQDLSDEAGWPDIPVKPMSLAIDPALGRFKFSEGRRAGSRLLGVQKLHMAMPTQLRVKGNYAYFGAEEGLNLWIIDVSNAAKPRLAGNACTGGFTKSIDVEGPYAVASNGMGQVTLFNISDPARPEVVSYLQIPGAYWPELDGQRLYVAGGGQMCAFDVSDVAHPRPLGKPIPGTRVVAEGGLVYLQNGAELEVWDWTDADSPKSLWKRRGVAHILAHGRHLGLLGAGRWTLMDFTDPAGPKEVQSFEAPVSDFDWDDTRLYVASGRDIHIFSRAEGREVDRIPGRDRPVTLGFGGGEFGYLGVRVQGDRLYARDIKVGLVIFDIREPATPKKLSEFLVLGGDFTGIAYDAARRLAYTGNNWGGFHAVDLADPAKPEILAWHQFEGVCGPTLFENWLYAGNNNGGLCIVDVSKPVEARLVGRFPSGLGGGDPRLGGANFSFRRGNLLYLPHRCTVLDVTDPAMPRLVGRLVEDDLLYTLCVHGDYAYLGGSPNFKIVDVRDPANPKELSRLTLEAYPQQGWGGYYFGRGIAYRNERVYVLNRAEFLVLDVGDRTNPRILSRVELPGFCSDLDLMGDYAYVAGYYDGLHVLDISDPARPMLVDHFQQGVYYDKAGWDNVACYQSVVVTPDYALLTEYYSGLTVVQVPYSSQSPRGRVTVECRQ